MMNKRFAIFSLVVFGILVFGSVLASAESVINKLNYLGEVFDNPDLFNVQTGGLKIVFLAVIVVIIFAGLVEAEFPKSKPLAFILSILVGYLATVFIASDEVVAAILSYKAFGMAIILFIPIMGLGFVTYVSVKKGKGLFIVAQRLLWLVYALFLIIYVLGLVVLRWDVGFNYNNDVSAVNIDKYNVAIASLRTAESNLEAADPKAADYKVKQDAVDAAERALDGSEEMLPGLVNQYRFIFGPDFVKYSKDLKISNTTLLILSVMALFVMWFFVIHNNKVVNYLEQDVRERDIDEEKNIIKKSHARDVANAEVVGKR